jgi:hypothetical protein
MDSHELYGTDAQGAADEEYCTYCFQDGAFTSPDLTLDEMIAKIVQVTGKPLTAEEKANSRTYLSTLKRWKT